MHARTLETRMVFTCFFIFFIAPPPLIFPVFDHPIPSGTCVLFIYSKIFTFLPLFHSLLSLFFFSHTQYDRPVDLISILLHYFDNSAVHASLWNFFFNEWISPLLVFFKYLKA